MTFSASPTNSRLKILIRLLEKGELHHNDPIFLETGWGVIEAADSLRIMWEVPIVYREEKIEVPISELEKQSKRFEL